MGKIRRSWLLTLATLRFVGGNPRLLVFPVIALAAFVISLALVAAGGAALSGVHVVPVNDFVTEATHHLVIFVPALLVGLGIGNFIALLCQAALVGCVLLQMEGKPHGLTDGLRLAWSRRSALFKWMLVTLSIGLALQLAERQFSRAPGLGPLVGKWVFRLVGMSWALVIFLVVPVMVFEDHPGIWAQLRRSGQLFKRSWGEQLVGRSFLILPTYIAMGVIFGLILAFSLTVGGSGGVASTNFILVSWIALGVFFLFVSPILRAMYGTYVAVLYGYAVTGMLPQEFSPDLLPPKPETPA